VVDNDKNFYRVTQEGLGWIEGFFTKRLYQVSKEDFVKSLSTAQHLSFVDYSSSLQHILETIEIGPAIFQFSQLAVNVWIGKGAILPRLSKQTKRELEQKLDLVQQ
jgi:hypothetical protein